MSTEQTVREVRHSRRSSYGSDLDAPVITHQQNRPRAHSNDNMLRGEHGAINHDELPKMFPWRNDVLPDRTSPPKEQINNGVNHIVDKNQTRPASQIGFERLSNGSEKHYFGEDDRNKYTFEGEKFPYANGTSAIIDMPVISPPKRSDSKIERIEMPTVPIRDDERSRSPSPTSADIYRRQNSHEHHTDISDNFSRLTLNENQKYSNGNITTNIMASENPLIKQTYTHSTSYENKQNHSRDSSPSANTNSNRSPSPTSGYASSSVHGERVLRDSTSPPSAHVPQHDYINVNNPFDFF